jgi:hypothetical protein
MFVLRYGVGGVAESCLYSALTRAGWVECEDGEEAGASLLWLPYSKVPWDLVIDRGAALCACYPVRTALVNKASLVATLTRVSGAPLSPPSFVVGGPSVEVEPLLCGARGPWVVKSCTRNNATGVVFVDTPAEVAAALPSLGFPAVVQAYVAPSPLLRGCKWHARVNILCVGACAVYVHADVVCHVAVEPLGAAGAPVGGSRLSQVTNHCEQRADPRYDRAAHTLLLPALLTQLGGAWSADDVLSAVKGVVARLFAALLQGKKLQWGGIGGGGGGGGGASANEGASLLPFFPHPRCFELFGADFLFVREEGGALEPVLLEVNGGPALEGLALPHCCAAVARDTVALVLPVARRGDPWPEPPVPREGNGWARVF